MILENLSVHSIEQTFVVPPYFTIIFFLANKFAEYARLKPMKK